MTEHFLPACRHLFGGRHCELAAGHHGPCTVGLAQAWILPCPNGRIVRAGYGAVPMGCHECDRIEAVEVMRLNNGGDLRPLQRMPGWMQVAPDSPSRRNTVAWARRVLGGRGTRVHSARGRAKRLGGECKS